MKAIEVEAHPVERTLADHFRDWESEVLGFGYGSGEPYVLQSLKLFLEACPTDGHYNYQRLEEIVGPSATWLLIGLLCRAKILEYGTSPRFGWLTDQGRALRAFVESHSVDDLCDIVCDWENGAYCTADSCNCGPRGYVEGKKLCHNPFWVERSAAA